MRDLRTDNDVRLVGTQDALAALGVAALRDCDVEGQFVLVIIPPQVAAGSPEQIAAFVAAAMHGT